MILILYCFSNRRTIDDPLAVFQRILRERDNKRRDMRNRHSMSRSRSRSLTRSRSRERSRSLSRSPSRILKHRTRSISRYLNESFMSSSMKISI